MKCILKFINSSSAERDGSGGGVGGEAAPDPALGAVAAKSRVNMGLPPLEILLLDRAGPLTRDIAWTFDGSVEPGTSTKAAMFLEGLAFGDEAVA